MSPNRTSATIARELAAFVSAKEEAGEVHNLGTIANPPAIPPVRPGSVRDAHRAFDVAASAIVREARKIETIPCKRGCDACCHDVTWAVEPEARELAIRVRSMPTRRRAAVLEALAAWFAGMAAAGLEPENNRPDCATYAAARLACPLLDRETHTCSVYDMRPMSCRGYFVLGPDARACANRATQPVVRALFLEPITAQALALAFGRELLAGELHDDLLPVALARELRALGLLA